MYVKAEHWLAVLRVPDISLSTPF